LQQEQEILLIASDIVREVYAAESAMLRAERAAGPASESRHLDAAAVLAHDAGLRVEGHARVALAAMTSGDTLRTMLAALRRILKIAPVDTIAARRRIADTVIERKAYPF